MPLLALVVGDGGGNRRGVVNGSAVTLRSSPALCPQQHLMWFGPRVRGVRVASAHPDPPLGARCYLSPWGDSRLQRARGRASLAVSQPCVSSPSPESLPARVSGRCALPRVYGAAGRRARQ